MALVDAPMCDCGAGPALMKTSRTDNNPGRKFYCCPNEQKVLTNFLQCLFFYVINYCVTQCTFGM